MPHESENQNSVPRASGDELLSVLANRRHRRILYCLKTSETPMALADLADELVCREADTSPTAVQDKRKQICISLYHRHLPQLADSGLVSFDINRKLVDLRADGDELSLDLVQMGEKKRMQ